MQVRDVCAACERSCLQHSMTGSGRVPDTAKEGRTGRRGRGNAEGESEASVRESNLACVQIQSHERGHGNATSE